MTDFLSEWGWALFLLFLGYVFGSIAERRHYRSINQREEANLNRAQITFEEQALPAETKYATLALGSVVISVDYFKRLLAYLRGLFGGRVGSYETLVDRARREALLRMVEQQPEADCFVNIRIETSSIWGESDSKRPIACVEAIAYGTAVFLK